MREDPEGEEFDTPELAVEEATRAAQEILAEAVKAGRIVDGQAFEITREDGLVIQRVPFRSALRLE